ASNPFITLLLVPIALTAAALSWRFVAVIAMLACAIYLALMRWYVPLPGMHLMHDAGFALHLTGMAVNFALAALLLATFVGRLSEALRRQDSAIREARERALRDQGILAIATQAAGVAHEMNTPLSSMRVLVAELLRERPSDADLRDDLALLAGEVERCRVVLRDMVATGREQLQARPHSATLEDFVDDCAQRFRLLRPEVTLELALDPSHAPVRMNFELDMAHAVLNLLHNAADATLQAGSNRIIFAGRIEHEALKLTVNDSGEGLPPRIWEVVLQDSSKSDGLGLGLLLARATAERLHGELRAFATAAGSAIEFSVPLAAIKAAR